MRVTLRIEIGIGAFAGTAEPGHRADLRLVELRPPRGGLHERLVVEARGNQRRQQVVDRAHVARQRGPAILAFRDQAIEQLDLRRKQIGRIAAGTAIDTDQRIGFLDTGSNDAARSVIFERPADEMHAIGEQGGRERVAGKAHVGFAVEREADPAAAIDAPAGSGPKRRAHRFAAASSCVRSGLGSPLL